MTTMNWKPVELDIYDLIAQLGLDDEHWRVYNANGGPEDKRDADQRSTGEGRF